MFKGLSLKVLCAFYDSVANAQPPKEFSMHESKDKKLSPRLERALQKVEQMDESVEIVLTHQENRLKTLVIINDSKTKE